MEVTKRGNMRLQRVQLKPACLLRCKACVYNWLWTDRDVIWADLDGKAFEDYYCENHARQLNERQPLVRLSDDI
jgi:hypothetical protein